MRHVYRQASRTVVWLGLTFDNSGLALLTCFKLAKEGEIADKLASVAQKQIQPMNPSAQRIIVTEKERDAVRGLVSRTWFQRYGQLNHSQLQILTSVGFGWSKKSALPRMLL